MAAERGDGDNEGPRAPEPETHDEEGPARRAARQRHLRAARDFFETAPPFRVQSEPDGTVSLRRKRYDYWPNRPPPDATRWERISIHQSLEQAEQRLRHMTSPHVYYDGRGRLTRAPAAPAGEGEGGPEDPDTPD